DYLRRRSGALLADNFERDLMRVPASQIVVRAPSLRANGHRLIAIKSALEGIAGNLRLETRRAFHHELPALDAGVSDSDLRVALQTAVTTLRPALRNSILFLGK